MAAVSDIADVRLRTDEPSETSTFTDEYIGSLIDTSGVAEAIAGIWDAKAAKAAKLVNVTEAGARHDMSNQFNQAQKMANEWRSRAGTPSGPRIKQIERS